jgi:hypothetical protein
MSQDRHQARHPLADFVKTAIPNTVSEVAALAANAVVDLYIPPPPLGGLRGGLDPFGGGLDGSRRQDRHTATVLGVGDLSRSSIPEKTVGPRLRIGVSRTSLTSTPSLAGHAEGDGHAGNRVAWHACRFPRKANTRTRGGRA